MLKFSKREVDVILYKIVKERLSNPEIGVYESYGIICGNHKIISDICLEYKPLKEFIANLNKYNIKNEELDYFIQEFLEEKINIIYKFTKE